MRIERIDPDEWEETYVIGDVHGCLDELESLLTRLDPGPRDLVLLVGDLVRKGPESRSVVELVRSRPNFRSVRGNNEAKLLRGDAQLSLRGEQLGYLESLPVGIRLGSDLIVHGGIDPRRPLDEQPSEALLTMRTVPPGNGYSGPFWFDRYAGPPRVFFGHTVVEDPLVTPDAVGLDTGCVYGGALTAYDRNRDRTVSVPAARAYQQRPPSKVLSTA